MTEGPGSEGGNVFPIYKEGDRPSASHLNAITRQMEASNAPFRQVATAAHIQRRVKITEEEFGGNDEIYTCQLMYYDILKVLTGNETEEDRWTLDEDQGSYEFDLLGGSYALGDKVIAYFDNQRGAFLPLVGTSGGGLVVRGTISLADCTAGTVDVLPVAFSGGCADIIGEIYGEIPDVTDPYNLMTPYTETELAGAKVRIEYMFPVDACMTGAWELTMIAGISGCA